MEEKGGKGDEGNPQHRWGYDVTLVTDTVEGQRLSETEALAEEMNKLARLSDSRSVRENSFARYPYVILFFEEGKAIPRAMMQKSNRTPDIGS